MLIVCKNQIKLIFIVKKKYTKIKLLYNITLISKLFLSLLFRKSFTLFLYVIQHK